MGRQHTILVVDDEPDMVQSARMLLRAEYQVLGATSAQEGLRLLRENEVHVVMSDLRMPTMSGVEFLRRAREERPEAVRLLFTGNADIRDVIDAINQGNVYRYITKPWEPDELMVMLRQATEQYDLRAERDRLLAELRTTNRELEQVNANLRKANDLKDAFIKVASHELRTPLTILLGLTELALGESAPSPPLATWLQGIRRAGERLNRLTDHLIQMLQAGHFEVPLDRRPTDLAILLREAAEDVRPFVQQRRQLLTVELEPPPGTLAVDAGKLRDCVDHLLLNAIKFTPDGGRIVLTARRAENAVEIRVGDSGLGIDAAALPHIFEPFFTTFDVSHHASGHFEFRRRGLGLGLSLVKAFVEMHGGRVTVASTPDHGSTFTITLPLEERLPPTLP